MDVVSTLWGDVLSGGSNRVASTADRQNSRSPNLAGNQLLDLMLAKCSELVSQGAHQTEIGQARENFTNTEELTKAKIAKFTAKFQQKGSAVLEMQRGLSCGIHSINNLFSRPGMVSALQILEMYKVMGESDLALHFLESDKADKSIPDAQKREDCLGKIDESLKGGDENQAHELIAKLMGGVEFNVWAPRITGIFQ